MYVSSHWSIKCVYISLCIRSLTSPLPEMGSLGMVLSVASERRSRVVAAMRALAFHQCGAVLIFLTCGHVD